MPVIEKIKKLFRHPAKKQKEQVTEQEQEQLVIDPNKIIDIGWFYPDQDKGTDGYSIFFKYGSGRIEIFPLEAFRNAIAAHSEPTVIHEEKKN